MTVLSIAILAMIGESIWETLKLVWQDGKISIDRIGAMVVCLLVALGSGFDLFKLVEIPLDVPYLGTVLTGLLLSRGSNFIHDIFNKINQTPKG